MATPIRWIFEGRGHGPFIFGANVGTINALGLAGCDRHTHVLASICELGQPQGEPLDFPFMGQAEMEIRNIVPGDDGVVQMFVFIAWGEDVNFRINLIVLND
jgi:hypothetical protein